MTDISLLAESIRRGVEELAEENERLRQELRGHRIDEGKIWATCPECEKMRKRVEAMDEIVRAVEEWKDEITNNGWPVLGPSRDLLRKYSKCEAALRSLEEGE